MKRHKGTHGGVVLEATGPDRELMMDQLNNLGPKNPVSRDQQLILSLMYSAVPFVPSVLLSTLNDDYLRMKSQFNLAYAGLPANIATDSAEYVSLSAMYNESMQKLFVLLLSKRLALYFLATAATLYAGWRGSMGVAAMRDGSVSGPGDALDRLNREILNGDDFLASTSKGADSEGNVDGDNDDDQLFATLIDDGPQSSNAGNILAVSLPLVLSATLAISYLTVSSGPSPSSESPNAFQEMLAPSLPYLFSLPSVGLCLLFMAAEFRWALPGNGCGGTSASSLPAESTNSSPLLRAGNILALAYVLGAYAAKIHPTVSLNSIFLDLWPLQNGVNIALAATVARGMSPFLLTVSSSSSTVPSPATKSIRTVALALIGITMFDAISVFGTVANAAVDATSTESMSVMETVARSKLASPSFAGLLEIIIGHDNTKVTEALGLGDVVFPSILVAWGFMADKDAVLPSLGTYSDSSNDEIGTSSSASGSYPYTTASIVGYLLGSFATEIVGSFSLLGKVSGLPALVFLVPSMIGTVTATAWARNELGEVWGVNGGNDCDGVGNSADL